MKKRRVISQISDVIDENDDVVGTFGNVILAVREGKDLFIEVDGVKVVKSGRPNTPQAMTWVSLEPGWEVISSPDCSTMSIRHKDTALH